MGLLKALNDDVMTIIMVTHNPDYAAYAHRVLLVSDGVLTQRGRPLNTP